MASRPTTVHTLNVAHLHQADQNGLTVQQRGWSLRYVHNICLAVLSRYQTPPFQTGHHPDEVPGTALEQRVSSPNST